MNAAASLQNRSAQPQPSSDPIHAGLLLQRKCACGSPTTSLTDECGECKRTKRVQPKLTVGASNDPLEQEADRVADQVLAAPATTLVDSVRPRIQRFSGQAHADASVAPPSVDRVLANPGGRLEPALRRDMEQRFGHDFSRVRVHSGETAEHSVRDVNALAYTAGPNIVFGAGRFAPETREGRHLIAHELAHVVQQSYAKKIDISRGEGNPSFSPPDPGTCRTAASEVAMRCGSAVVQRVACEALAPPNCAEGTCDEGQTCAGYDWPACSCWTTAELERWRRVREIGGAGSGYKGSGGTTGGGGSSDRWDE